MVFSRITSGTHAESTTKRASCLRDLRPIQPYLVIDNKHVEITVKLNMSKACSRDLRHESLVKGLLMSLKDLLGVEEVPYLGHIGYLM